MSRIKTKEITVYMNDRFRDIVTRDCHFNHEKIITSTYHSDTPFKGKLTVYLPPRKTTINGDQLSKIILSELGISDVNTKVLMDRIFRNA